MYIYRYRYIHTHICIQGTYILGTPQVPELRSGHFGYKDLSHSELLAFRTFRCTLANNDHKEPGTSASPDPVTSEDAAPCWRLNGWAIIQPVDVFSPVKP